ncbi:hypothetical protein RISINGSUN_156 [Erwinia phage vB_EamM_RisingSun]|uniref:Uncharacterized protein n=2 Tax=Risingsunvirus risingsun TaxID=2560435 RepID=A0A223LH14_9CAUD|nr:hypothetical protein FDI45_gp156 [Erwinia phage vB_EamM_RisingSun]ASU03514.1 hypothetical protein RISINGSUN_156 [Erwinia phage vB_EamM_RisingSun]ASU03758.1 hypothetical protein JOAD_157 [Erwinia phage vB_EamM_Joad]
MKVTSTTTSIKSVEITGTMIAGPHKLTRSVRRELLESIKREELKVYQRILSYGAKTYAELELAQCGEVTSLHFHDKKKTNKVTVVLDKATWENRSWASSFDLVRLYVVDKVLGPHYIYGLRFL